MSADEEADDDLLDELRRMFARTDPILPPSPEASRGHHPAPPSRGPTQPPSRR